MATISQSTETVLISAKETGTPSDGMVVPHRPGPSSMIRLGGPSSCKCMSRPIRRAIEYRSLIGSWAYADGTT